MLLRFLTIALSFSLLALASPEEAKHDILVKLSPKALASAKVLDLLKSKGAKIEVLTDQWVRVHAGNLDKQFLTHLSQNKEVLYIQPNYPLYLLEDYAIPDPFHRLALQRSLSRQVKTSDDEKKYLDNPEIIDSPEQQVGVDPLFFNQWGMKNVQAEEAWKVTRGSPEMIVAVIDTGVDYTHEDLLPNLWRNPKEVADNGLDDDNNGLVDDLIGWDFVSNDNKPYDLALKPLELLSGGNPGHGTHCAGNVAARGENGIGIAGVAPNIRIMALRFISEKGKGTSADAIKAIKYAVDNGAKILSNSWGTKGENPADGPANQALRDAIQDAEARGVLFIAAAGNGERGRGYDNDTHPRPVYPASYDHENIISVAALDVNDNFGTFSNWGIRSVDIAAPGVKVYSTVIGSEYSDLVINHRGIKASWNGTSMATPHVAGAAALYWSANPSKNWREVRNALLATAKKIPAAHGKLATEGKLDVNALMHY